MPENYDVEYTWEESEVAVSLFYLAFKGFVVYNNYMYTEYFIKGDQIRYHILETDFLRALYE